MVTPCVRPSKFYNLPFPILRPRTWRVRHASFSRGMRENRASKLSGFVQMSDFRPKLEAGIRHAAPRGMNSSIQTRLIRISIIVAVLTGFVVGSLNVIKVREKIRHQQGALKEQADARQRAEAELSATRAALRTTSASLNQTKATLESVTAEKEQALAGAAAQS